MCVHVGCLSISRHLLMYLLLSKEGLRLVIILSHQIHNLEFGASSSVGDWANGEDWRRRSQMTMEGAMLQASAWTR